MEGQRRPLGYAYRSRFSMDVDILQLYKQQIDFCYGSDMYKCFLFEIRTNFILKPTGLDAGAEEIIDSERCASILPLSINEEIMTAMSTANRLLEYWMTLEELRGLVRDALDFSKQTLLQAEAPLHVIPIVVDLDVCTVQLRGESLDVTANRSIKTHCLIPYHLYMLGSLNMLPSGERSMEDEGLRFYWLKLFPHRVEDVSVGLAARMKVCPICSRAPTFGAVLTTLPCDHNHVFHKHCVTRHLLLNKSCPQCHFKIVTNYF